MNNWPNFGYHANSGIGGVVSASVFEGANAADVVSSSSGVITADFAVPSISGVAPFYVNVDASATTSSASTYPMHELLFGWSFGDSGAGNWVQGPSATSRNVDYAPWSGHVYETASGSPYTITLGVSNAAGDTSVKTASITVADPNVFYAGTATVCISSSGNFTGAPSGSTHITTTAGSTDLAAAYALVASPSGKRILFCKADTWTATSTLSFANLTNTHIGGYGTGASFTRGYSGTAVVVNITSGASNLFTVNANNVNLKFCEFKITTSVIGCVPCLVNNSVSGLLFYKIECNGAYTSFKAYPGGGTTNNVFDQLCYFECTSDNIWGYGIADYSPTQYTGGVGMFTGLVRGGILGCYIDQCNHGEHPLRQPFLDRAHTAHNYIARPNQTKNVVKIHSFNYTDFGLSTAKFVHRENVHDLRGGYTYGGAVPLESGGTTPATEVGDCAIVCGNGGSSENERVSNGIIEDNITYACLGQPKGMSFLSCSATDITVRNNIADFSLGDRTTAFSPTYPYSSTTFVSLGKGLYCPTPSNIQIYNNTLYSNISGGDPSTIVATNITTVAADNITVKNNLYYEPFNTGGHRGVIYDGNLATTNVHSSNNTFDVVAGNTVSPGFVATPPVALTDWRPNTGSYAIGSGAAVPVLRDFNNAARTGNHLGAVIP